MGATISSQTFKQKRFLFEIKFMENRLHVFFPDSHSSFKFQLYLNKQKFYYLAQEMIALLDGSIYMIGGRKLPAELASVTLHNSEDPQVKLITTDEVYRINLSKQKDMQIELSDSKACAFLPKPRHSHVLLHSAPYIYVIGGQYEDFTTAKACLRFHTKTKQWSSIRDFDLPVEDPSNLTGINIDNQKLYIFDSSKDPLPNIYQYNIETNVWVQLVIHLKNKHMSIPPSLNTFLFRISDNKLLVLSGDHSVDQKRQRGYSYFVDITTEKIEDFRLDRALDFTITDHQGNKDFRNEDRVYIHFNEKTVDLFDKRMGMCERIDIRESDGRRQEPTFNIACCSRKQTKFLF